MDEDKYVYVLLVESYGPCNQRDDWIVGVFDTYTGALAYCNQRKHLTIQEIIKDRMTDGIDTVFFDVTSLGSKTCRYYFTLQRHKVQ